MAMNTMTSSNSWGYQPVYNTTATSSMYQSEPSFSFQSTSTYISPAKAASEGIKSRPVLRKETNPFGGLPTGEEIGILPPKVPIGSPIILMAFAILYIACKSLFRKRSFLRK